MHGYTGYGYGDGVGRFRSLISDEMREDWEANGDKLVAFWQSGEYTNAEAFPDTKPWLFACGGPNEMPWAALQFKG